MIILANVLSGVASILGMILQLVLLLVVVRVVISWLSADPYNPIVRFVVSATDPLYRPVRKHLPVVLGGLDLSPIVVCAVILFLQAALVQTIADYASQLRYQALQQSGWIIDVQEVV